MDSFGIRLKCGTASFFLSLALLQAQQPTGQIHLEVKDPSGASMAASGRLQNSAGGAPIAFETDRQGVFTSHGLAFGRYRMEISKRGFVGQSIWVDVQSATPVSRVVTLALASQTSKIDVVA